VRGRWIAALIVLALLPSIAGCYGRFPLTKAVYEINGSVEDKYARSAVMWLFVIVPIYGGAVLADALVLNLLEFWTGEDILARTHTDAEGNRIVVQPDESGRRADVTVYVRGETPSRLQLVRVSEEQLELRDGSGAVLGTAVRGHDGGLRLTDSRGRVLESVTATDLAACAKREETAGRL
jgi:hypothetical protein